MSYQDNVPKNLPTVPDNPEVGTPVKVIGSVFKGGAKEGDFNWMINQPQYDDALFIFNDNQEQFLEHRKNPHSAFGCTAGGGNAIIRPYQCQLPPRATGIPTGSQGSGYSALTPQVKQYIDDAYDTIQQILANNPYKRVYFSSTKNGDLGTGIFDVSEDVKTYIVQKLKSLSF